MVVSIIMTVLGACALIVGFIGCIVPAIPGPILGFLSLIMISISGQWQLFPWWTLLLLGAFALFTTVIDNILPVWASKKSGAGKSGVWGSVFGMIVGSFLFPPFGTIIGAFVGALLGELLFNRSNERPLKAAFGVFKGTMLGILIKIAAIGATAFFYFRGVVQLLSG